MRGSAMPDFEIPEDALSESFLAASGPGGQNVNKVATACQLRCDVFRLGLAPEVYQRLKALAGSRMTAGGEIVITARQYRTQEGNREAARADIAGLWAAAEPSCRALGLVPMEVLQSGFWKLDPARTIAKYEAYGSLDPDSPAARSFVALEDWANAGAPLTYAAGAQLFDFVTHDAPGRGAWTVAGRTIDPTALACPAVDFVSTSDRIVPAASAARLADTRRLSAGHVGMIVGGRARAQLWEPLAEWLG